MSYTPTTEDVRRDYATMRDDLMCSPTLEKAKAYRESGRGGAEFDRWLRELKAEVWAEGRQAKRYMFGHYYDCCGWGDCYCETYINPYSEAGEGIVAFCGDLESHDRHDVPVRGTPDSGWYLPAHTCPGFFQCEECYEVEYAPQPHHVCQEEE